MLFAPIIFRRKIILKSLLLLEEQTVKRPLNFKKVSAQAHAKVWETEFNLIHAYKEVPVSYIDDFDLEESEISEEAEGIVFMEWDNFFDLCNIFRDANNIHPDDFVVLLTPHYNTDNWFASYCNNSNNIFAHTEDWGYYLTCSSVYPITYLVMSQVVQKLIYPTVNEKVNRAHKKPRGCINDFCGDKSQISFKLRTADICPTCLEEIKQIGKHQDLITQAFSLFENIRREMLHIQHNKPTLSKLQITTANEIILTDYQNTTIELSPLYKTVFFLFLKHPNGIKLNEREYYRAEVETIYRQLNIFAPAVNDMDEDLIRAAEADFEQKLMDSVRWLTTPGENSIYEKIARIKSAFLKSLERHVSKEYVEEIAENYIVKGARTAPYKIKLDRDMVSCESGILG